MLLLRAVIRWRRKRALLRFADLFIVLVEL